MTPLRKRMIEDMEIRNYSPKTIRTYVDCVIHFAKFFRKSPAVLGPEHIRKYQLHLVKEKRASWSLLNQTVCALRFLYLTILKKSWVVDHIPFAKKPKTLPVVLAQKEIGKLFRHTGSLKYRTVFRVMYATGIRLSEALNLRISDIDSKRKVIRIRQGKGKKDRYAPLSKTLLSYMRAYWKKYKPQNLLFPGRDPERPLNATSVQKAFTEARKLAGISKPVSPHTMRHCFATHHLEDGTDLRTIQVILGHTSLNTTSVYLHVSANAPQLTTQAKDLLATIDDGQPRQ